MYVHDTWPSISLIISLSVLLALAFCVGLTASWLQAQIGKQLPPGVDASKQSVNRVLYRMKAKYVEMLEGAHWHILRGVPGGQDANRKRGAGAI